MNATVRERPIIMSGPSVLAIMEGRKTQTRRVVKPQPPNKWEYRPGHVGMILTEQPFEFMGKNYWGYGAHWGSQPRMDMPFPRCPYGRLGDRLWVRETWTADFGGTFSDNRDAWWHEMPASLRTSKATQWIYYHADDSVYHGPWARSPDLPVEASRSGWEPTERDLEGRRWQSPIHMPRWASRITLEVMGVRFHRLQAITEDDIDAEGIGTLGVYLTSQERRDRFAEAWDTLNAKRGYPWASNPWVWATTFEVVP